MAKFQEHKYLWILQDVLVPLGLTRLAIILVAWFSQYFVSNPDYPIKEALRRGWQFSPYKLLDMWARWDTGWYLSIIRQGYKVSDITSQQSNIVFFPLYPYLVRFTSYLIPSSLRTTSVLLLIGILLSNIFLLIALILFYKLVVDLFNNQTVARRSVWYLLLFPTSFFFSCFYTEATFLLLCVGAFYAAIREKWAIASLLGCLLALSRPLGVLIIVPLMWMYMENRNWKLMKMRTDIVWFILIPIGLFAFWIFAFSLTGDYFAPLNAQAAWGKRGTITLWQILVDPSDPHYSYFVTHIDQLLTIVFIALSAIALKIMPSASYGIYSLVLILPPIMTGTLISQSRYLAVVFPAFIVMALAGRWRIVDQVTTIIFLSMQVLFVAAWTRFYWIA